MRCRGLALVELVVVVGMLALVVALVVPQVGAARSENAYRLCLWNLRTYELGSMSHAADHKGLLPNFTWIGYTGSTWTSPSQYSDLVGPFPNASSAHAAEAVDLIRRTGRDDFPLDSWIPNPLYSHLPLFEYLGEPQPSLLAVCPSNEFLPKWQYWELFEKDAFAPYQPTPGADPNNMRWPYSSNYEANLAAWDYNASQDVNAATGPAVAGRAYPSTSSSWYIPGSARFGGTTYAHVAFPSSKVHWNDNAQRHTPGQPMFYGYDEARVTMSFFDGSVTRGPTGKANLGWLPIQPTRSTPIEIMHHINGKPWLEPIPGGDTQRRFTVRYLSTRCGLQGVDYYGDSPGCGLP